jgi:tRNA wybutosine-synthesizing protein 1
LLLTGCQSYEPKPLDLAAHRGAWLARTPGDEPVRAFAEQLVAVLGHEWLPAVEHEHSNMVVLAKPRFRDADGTWRTWIDYDKFSDLIMEWYRSKTPFDATQYAAPTPSWAVYNASEAGFDPADTRVFRGGKERRDERVRAVHAAIDDHKDEDDTS